jgi:hypothetical protein
LFGGFSGFVQCLWMQGMPRCCASGLAISSA